MTDAWKSSVPAQVGSVVQVAEEEQMRTSWWWSCHGPLVERVMLLLAVFSLR